VSLSRLRLMLWLVVGVVALGMVAFVWRQSERQSTVTQTALGNIGGPFTLTGADGKPFASSRLNGRPAAIFFGFTHCPDVCPTTLTVMTAALDRLPKEQAEQVVPIFVTVDPARDTVDQLATYAPLFHPRLVALTGTEEEVGRAARAYRVYYHVPEGQGDAYLVDHSSFVYLMGPDGEYRTHFGIDASPEAMAERISEEIAATS
jgi:protein SCO1/2